MDKQKAIEHFLNLPSLDQLKILEEFYKVELNLKMTGGQIKVKDNKIVTAHCSVDNPLSHRIDYIVVNINDNINKIINLSEKYLSDHLKTLEDSKMKIEEHCEDIHCLIKYNKDLKKRNIVNEVLQPLAVIEELEKSIASHLDSIHPKLFLQNGIVMLNKFHELKKCVRHDQILKNKFDITISMFNKFPVQFNPETNNLITTGEQYNLDYLGHFGAHLSLKLNCLVREYGISVDNGFYLLTTTDNFFKAITE